MLSFSLSPQLADILASREEQFNRAVIRSAPPEFRTVLRECQTDWYHCHTDLMRGSAPDLYNLVARFCRAAESAGQQGPAYVLRLIEFQTQTLQHFLREHQPDLGNTEIELVCLNLARAYEHALLEWCDREQTERHRGWERLLRAVVDVLEKPLSILDNQGRITQANPEMARLLGADPESLRGVDFVALCDAETAGLIRSQVRKRQNILANQEFEGVFSASPGLRYPVLMRPIFNAEGVRDGFLLWIDVKTASAGALEAGILFYVQQALNTLPFPAQLINPAGRIAAQNAAAENLLELSDNGHSRRICCLISRQSGETGPCACERAALGVQAVFEEKKVTEQEHGIQSSRWFRVGSLPIHIPPEHTPWLFCWVVENKSHEEIEERVERLESEYRLSTRTMRLVLSVAMQLRSPLSVILGVAELLRAEPSGKRLAEIAEMLSRKAVRCKRIIDSLLGFGQGISLDVVPVELVKLVRERVRNALGTTRQWQVEWRLPPYPVWVECFPEQMVSVLLALLDNALYFAKNAIIFEITATREHAIIRISDDGPGIDPSVTEKIFEPFFTTRNEENAPGLGLALARATIQEHGGDITVNLDQNRELPGAQLVISLPLSPVAMESQALIANRSRQHAPKILVAEDDPDLRTVLGETLTGHGFSVTLFGSGEACLKEIAQISPDIVVLDIRFSTGLDGISVYRKIVESVPALSRRIIFITADAMDYEVRKFLNTVACPVLEKPFMLSDLVEKIQELILGPNENTSAAS